MIQVLELEERREVLRNETELERIDRNLGELLQELRVVTTGVQVMFAFLLIVPFNAGFAKLSTTEHYIYLAILLVTAASSALLIAPTALHRLIFRQGDKPFLVEIANRLAISGIACLMLAMTGILGLLCGHLFGTAAGIVVGVGAACFFGTLWFGVGLLRRRTLKRGA